MHYKQVFDDLTQTIEIFKVERQEYKHTIS